MMGQLVLLLELAVGAFVILALSVELARRPQILVYAYLGVYCWGVVAALPKAQVAGIDFSPEDIVNVVAFGAAVIRLRRPRGLQFILLGFAAFTLITIGRGLIEFGSSSALPGSRVELYFIVPALLASSLERRHFAPVLRAVSAVGAGLAVLAAIRWTLLGFGVDIGYRPASDAYGYEIARVVNSGATFVIAISSIKGIRDWLNRQSSGYLALASAGMLVVVLFAQHRSVWASVAVMLALVMVQSRVRVRLRVGLTTCLVVLGVSAALLDAGSDSIVADSLSYATSNVGTWEWRLERWELVWRTHTERGPVAIVFGSGYGHGWVPAGTGMEEVSPHNGYVQVAVRTGLVGALLLFGTYLAVLVGLARGGRTEDGLLFVFTVGVLIYFIPYSASAFSGVLLGVAVAWRVQHSARPEGHARLESGRNSPLHRVQSSW